MKSMTIYYLDSLRGSMDGFLMNIMQIGLTHYHSHNGNQSDKGVVQWERVQVPMQSVDVECGYYVLRFMKDIIADRSVLTENAGVVVVVHLVRVRVRVLLVVFVVAFRLNWFEFERQ
ncbi:hypothetical protein QYF36_025814 [Acer negundo]|nr:hypothetical protein QYF36_025814 [Acer negundo]